MARYRKLRRLSPHQRGTQMLADSHLQLMCAVSLYARDFALCSTDTKCDRIARTIVALRSAILKFRLAEDVAALDCAFDAFKYRAAGQLHPLFAHRRTDQRKAERMLKGDIPGKQSSHFVKAWSLTALQLLRESGMTEIGALRKVADPLHRTVDTVREWQKELNADTAPLRPEAGAAHLQRLSFRVKLCRSYANEHKLSGAQMLRLIKSDPQLVYRYSLRADHGPFSKPSRN